MDGSSPTHAASRAAPKSRKKVRLTSPTLRSSPRASRSLWKRPKVVHEATSDLSRQAAALRRDLLSRERRDGSRGPSIFGRDPPTSIIPPSERRQFFLEQRRTPRSTRREIVNERLIWIATGSSRDRRSVERAHGLRAEPVLARPLRAQIVPRNGEELEQQVLSDRVWERARCSRPRPP